VLVRDTSDGQPSTKKRGASPSFDAAYFAAVRRAAIGVLGAQVDATLPAMPTEGRIPWALGRALWCALDAHDDGALGVRLAAALTLDEGGVVLLRHAASGAGTLESGLSVLARYFRLMATSDRLEIEVRDNDDALVVRPVYGPDVRYPVASVLFLCVLAREIEVIVDGAIAPRHLTLLTPVKDGRVRLTLESAFRCAVHTGVEGDALVFARSEGARALRRDLSRPPHVDDALDDAMRTLSKTNAIEADVRREMRQLFPSAPSVALVAKRLSLSARTLQRRLADEGVSFQRVADDVRISFAQQLFARGVSATDTAFLVGYQDLSTFSRAFKRATGKSPRALRRAP
jgi:AraC-like DNA-binding protein